tara:strand:- start:117 stop:434 length:318 start_codon:yes stop_codon:yes gene_type:complete
MQENPFLRLLEEEPIGQRALFFGNVPQNLTFGQQRFAQNLFDPTLNRYLGTLGRQVIGGGAPTNTFADYLRNSFDFGREFRRAPTSQTGLGASSFVSPGRFLLNL